MGLDGPVAECFAVKAIVVVGTLEVVVVVEFVVQVRVLPVVEADENDSAVVVVELFLVSQVDEVDYPVWVVALLSHSFRTKPFFRIGLVNAE